MSNMHEQFWMVYGIGQGQPERRHHSRDEANREARRLASRNPEVAFVVLEAVELVIKREFVTINYRAPSKATEDDSDLIPF